MIEMNEALLLKWSDNLTSGNKTIFLKGPSNRIPCFCRCFSIPQFLPVLMKKTFSKNGIGFACKNIVFKVTLSPWIGWK